MTDSFFILGLNVWAVIESISIAIHTFTFKKIHLKISHGKWRQSCPGLTVVKQRCNLTHTWGNMKKIGEVYASNFFMIKWSTYTNQNLDGPHNNQLLSNFCRFLVGNEFVDHSNAVGASSFFIQHLASVDWAKTTTRRHHQKHFSFWARGAHLISGLKVYVCWSWFFI